MNFLGSVVPIKVLIGEEISNRENIKHGGPNVVARLMGMDSLPPEIERTIHVKEILEESPRKYMSRVPHFESHKTKLTSLSSTSFKKLKEESPLNYAKQYSRLSAKYVNSVTPPIREHPQEELLEKFKQEFEAWQASKMWKCSRSLDLNNNDQVQKNEQIISQENLGLGMARCSNRNRYMLQKKPTENEVYCSANNFHGSPIRLDGFYYDGNIDKQCSPRTRENMATRKKKVSKDHQTSSTMFLEKRSRSCSAKKIVILKPSSDSDDNEEPWGGGTSGLPEKGRSMEDFLEEVKERLRMEVEGKRRTDSMRGIATHTSLHERSGDPKQLARDIAKHIRESVSKELGMTLLRSESTRTCKNAFHLNEQLSLESIRRDTRKFMSDRLKNTMKDDANREEAILGRKGTGRPLLMKGKERTKLLSDYSKIGKNARYWEDKKAVNESIPKHLRLEQVKKAVDEVGLMSPPNLTRSRSAPVSGNAFRKLLLEDRDIMRGTHVPEEDEASEDDSVMIVRNKKIRFNLKGTVLNLKRNFSFRSSFFRKKISSVKESTAVDTFYYEQPFETIPFVVRNFGLVQDNSTEVPPSPASFSRSPISEHHSPVSPLEVPFVEDNSSVPVSGELRMGLKESESCPEQVDCKGSEVGGTEAQFYSGAEATSAKGNAEAYVRDILVLLGIYMDWTPDQARLSLDGQTKPIPPWVFDEVEENYCKHGKQDHDYCKLDDMTINRRMLFDLVNEALPCIFGSPLTHLMRKRWIQDVIEWPQGRRLLDVLLHQIRIYANPKFDEPQSVDTVVAWDVKLMPLSAVSHEDISSVGKEVVHVILGELIDVLVSDLMV